MEYAWQTRSVISRAILRSSFCRGLNRARYREIKRVQAYRANFTRTVMNQVGDVRESSEAERKFRR